MTKKALMFPADEPIVSMAIFSGTMFVATTRAVYKLVDGKRLEALQIETELPEIEQAHVEKEEAIRKADSLARAEAAANEILPEAKP